MFNEVLKPKGSLIVVARNVKTGEVFLMDRQSGPNSISSRSKLILSRLLAGNNKTISGDAPLTIFGKTYSIAWPDTVMKDYDDDATDISGFSFGDAGSKSFLGVTGMAFGNGGHLMYPAAVAANPYVIPKEAQNNAGPGGSAPIVDTGAGFGEDLTKAAMPYLAAGPTFGYDSLNNPVPNPTSYVQVENGVVPWKGDALATNDNNVAVDEANTTLYSETLRLPLDPTDGITFSGFNLVTFKCTIPAVSEVNQERVFGFARRPRNIITEIGLITGDNLSVQAPDKKTWNVTKGDVAIAGTVDGVSNAYGEELWTGGDAPASTQADDGSPWGGGAAITGNPLAKDHYTKGTLSGDGTSADAGYDNTWNLFARRVFGNLTKTPDLEFTFAWTIAF